LPSLLDSCHLNISSVVEDDRYEMFNNTVNFRNPEVKRVSIAVQQSLVRCVMLTPTLVSPSPSVAAGRVV
jgi:hypothetical protein